MKFLKFLVVLLTIFATSTFAYGYLYEKEVIGIIEEYFDRTPSTLVSNEYKKEINVNIFKQTDNFIAKNKEDLKSIYYTIIYSGMDEFTFFCSEEYTTCIQDVIAVEENNDFLSEINNFVNVFNRFYTIKVSYDRLIGKITLYINKTYTEKDIEEINNKLNELEQTLYEGKETDREKILAIHDYIINNTKYDLNDPANVLTPSKTAVGVFINHLATCNGYTDAIAILLDRLDIPNLKISNDDHIWNLVYVDGMWLHLDATWDDPIVPNNPDKDILQYDYFLKTTEEFEKLNTSQNKHNFNKEIYNFVS